MLIMGMQTITCDLHTAHHTNQPTHRTHYPTAITRQALIHPQQTSQTSSTSHTTSTTNLALCSSSMNNANEIFIANHHIRIEQSIPHQLMSVILPTPLQTRIDSPSKPNIDVQQPFATTNRWLQTVHTVRHHHTQSTSTGQATTQQQIACKT
jgi:hypothetical protein